MSKGMPPFLFWVVYTIAAIWLQAFFPGLDFFAPALLICLQYRQLRILSCLLLPWIMIQEGSGSLNFGFSLLSYSGLILFFYLTRVFLDTMSFLFILLFSVFTGAWVYFALQMLTSLQELHIIREQLIYQSLQNTLILPILWLVLNYLKKRFCPANHA